MKKNELSLRQAWSAVGSMALCVSMLVTAEFMPVSLLTPLARDLRATEGMAGQAISISGLFAVVASLVIATVAGRYNRRHVLLGLTGIMLASLILIAVAPNFLTLMIARALLGVVVGGFWALATATVMRLVPEETVPKALGIIYTGLAVASAFAAPIRELLGRHHWLAGCFLGSDAPRGGDSNLAMAEPAVDGASNDQPCRKAFWAAEATPCRLRDGCSHAHLRRGICEFHIPATVP